MHIKINLGGKHTFISFDIPVPVIGWLWDDVHRKYFLEKEVLGEIKREEIKEEAKEKSAERKTVNQEVQKLIAARKLFEQSVQESISERNGKHE